jgi:hypothetical protein
MSALDLNNVVSDFAAAQRAVAVPAEQWQAWKLGERESMRVPLDAPNTLDEAVAQALVALCWHPGDMLTVQRIHTGRNKITLWQHAVRRSAKRYSWRPATDGGKPVKVCEPEAKLLLQTELAAPFAPVERFDAFRDDPAGRDLTLVQN